MFTIVDTLDDFSGFSLYKTQEKAEEAIRNNRYFDEGLLVEIKIVKKFKIETRPKPLEVVFSEEREMESLYFEEEEEEEEEEDEEEDSGNW